MRVFVSTTATAMAAVAGTTAGCTKLNDEYFVAEADSGTSGGSTSSVSASVTTVTTAGMSTSSSGSGGTTGWLAPSYPQRKPIRIRPPTNLTDFPVGIVLADPDLAEMARADGGDLVFTADDGTTVLPYEIEEYTAGDLTAWVLVPTLVETDDTTIYLYYGDPEPSTAANPEATWPPSRFAGVWHLSLQGRVALDSTSHGNDASTPNDDLTPADAPGIAGRAASYDGTGDALSAGDPLGESLDFGSESFSLSLWVRVTQSIDQFDTPLYKGGGNGADTGYGVFLGSGGWNTGVADGTNEQLAAFGQDPALTGQWNHLVVVVDRQQAALRTLLNGVRVDEAALDQFGSMSTGTSFDIGRANGFFFRGLTDEVRLYHGVVSSDWARAEFVNLFEPASFLTVDAREGR